MNLKEYKKQRLILLEELLAYLRVRFIKTFSIPISLYEIVQKIETLEREYSNNDSS